MKDKINYKLVNIALISLIIFFLYRTGHLWIGVTSKFFQIMMPFIVAFVIAYALYPFLKYLENKKIPKGLAIFLIIAIFIGLLAFIIFLVVPLLYNQTINLFNSSISYVKEISKEYNYDLGPLQDALTTGLNDIVMGVGKYISNGAINIINASMSLLTKVFLALTAATTLVSIPPKYGINCIIIAKKPSNMALGCPIIVYIIEYSNNDINIIFTNPDK